MSFDNGFAPRQMFDVSAMGLKCADCGAPITELPFEPKADRPVYCRDCYERMGGGQRAGGGRPSYGGGGRR